MEASAFWSRFDLTGSDACRLDRLGDGLRISGDAVFFESEPVALRYAVDVDTMWRTRAAAVSGFHRGRLIKALIEHVSGEWLLDGEVVSGLSDCIDIDLGFTPATNMIAIRRLALDVGASAAVTSVWYDIVPGTLSRLEQTYERLGDKQYRYSAPAFEYNAVLEVASDGFVVDYPGLWRRIGP